jgi:hypothetical protein
MRNAGLRSTIVACGIRRSYCPNVLLAVFVCQRPFLLEICMKSFHAIRSTIEQLDERTLPSATVLDLTSHGAEVTNGSFIARQIDAQPTGTGYIDSFVRIQGAASGGGAEQGYNTTARPLQFDENKSPQFTRSLALGQVPVVMVDGVAYREFLLDINKKSSSPLLSVD